MRGRPVFVVVHFLLVLLLDWGCFVAVAIGVGLGEEIVSCRGPVPRLGFTLIGEMAAPTFW